MNRNPRTSHRGRSTRTRLLDRFDPYLLDECTFTREEITQARG